MPGLQTNQVRHELQTRRSYVNFEWIDQRVQQCQDPLASEHRGGQLPPPHTPHINVSRTCAV